MKDSGTFGDIKYVMTISNEFTNEEDEPATAAALAWCYHTKLPCDKNGKAYLFKVYEVITRLRSRLEINKCENVKMPVPRCMSVPQFRNIVEYIFYGSIVKVYINKGGKMEYSAIAKVNRQATDTKV